MYFLLLSMFAVFARMYSEKHLYICLFHLLFDIIVMQTRKIRLDKDSNCIKSAVK